MVWYFYGGLPGSDLYCFQYEIQKIQKETESVPEESEETECNVP